MIQAKKWKANQTCPYKPTQAQDPIIIPLVNKKPIAFTIPQTDSYQQAKISAYTWQHSTGWRVLIGSSWRHDSKLTEGDRGSILIKSGINLNDEIN